MRWRARAPRPPAGRRRRARSQMEWIGAPMVWRGRSVRGVSWLLAREAVLVAVLSALVACIGDVGLGPDTSWGALCVSRSRAHRPRMRPLRLLLLLMMMMVLLLRSRPLLDAAACSACRTIVASAEWSRRHESSPASALGANALLLLLSGRGVFSLRAQFTAVPCTRDAMLVCLDGRCTASLAVRSLVFRFAVGLVPCNL